jgi:hypothetical protein
MHCPRAVAVRSPGRGRRRRAVCPGAPVSVCLDRVQRAQSRAWQSGRRNCEAATLSTSSGGHMNAPAGLLALALSAFLGAACCPAAQAQVRVNPHDEAARLIRALDLSTAQRNAALDFMIVEMARGGSAPLPRGHVFRLARRGSRQASAHRPPAGDGRATASTSGHAWRPG